MSKTDGGPLFLSAKFELSIPAYSEQISPPDPLKYLKARRPSLCFSEKETLSFIFKIENHYF